MCPPELMHPGASARNPVKIDLKRERRDWTPQKGVKAFSGSGNSWKEQREKETTRVLVVAEMEEEKRSKK